MGSLVVEAHLCCKGLAGACPVPHSPLDDTLPEDLPDEVHQVLLPHSMLLPPLLGS